jgi:hypothetical protein
LFAYNWSILFILNKVITFLFLSISSVDEGWYPVEKKVEAALPADQRDASLWVLFVKDWGGERIQIRFPEEPQYRYTEEGDFEAWVEQNGAYFSLIWSQNGGVSLVGNERFISSFSIEKI